MKTMRTMRAANMVAKSRWVCLESSVDDARSTHVRTHASWLTRNLDGVQICSKMVRVAVVAVISCCSRGGKLASDADAASTDVPRRLSVFDRLARGCRCQPHPPGAYAAAARLAAAAGCPPRGWAVGAERRSFTPDGDITRARCGDGGSHVASRRSDLEITRCASHCKLQAASGHITAIACVATRARTQVLRAPSRATLAGCRGLVVRRRLSEPRLTR